MTEKKVRTSEVRPNEPLSIEASLAFVRALHDFESAEVYIRRQFNKIVYFPRTKVQLMKYYGTPEDFPPGVQISEDTRKDSLTFNLKAANEAFNVLQLVLPELDYRSIPEISQLGGTYSFRSNDKMRTWKKFDSAFGVFKYAIEQRLISLPEKLSVPFEVITTGKWKGKPVRDYVADTPQENKFLPSTSDSTNRILVEKGSPEDHAFYLFSILGFFRLHDDGTDLHYYEFKRKVDVNSQIQAFMDRVSIFKDRVSDLEVLSILKPTPSQSS